VIKEIPVMTTVPAETGSRSAARVLALALVQVLALGLPDPGYITVSPWAADSPYVSSIDLQFDGDGEAAAVEAWADRFDVSAIRTDGKPGRCWVSAEFTYLDVVFKVYAETAADDT
jgi:hypothetical protein